MNNNLSLESEEIHKIVLSYIRRLEKAIKNILGQINSDDLFVKSEQRTYMNEIASADPKLLDTTIIQFIQEYRQTGNLKTISNLRDIFTEKLIKICTSLPSDDEEWEHSLSQNNGPLLSTTTTTVTTTTSAKEQNPLTSWTKIENPWVTKSRIPTKMPYEYEAYVEGIEFLGIYEMVRTLKPFGPIEPKSEFWDRIKDKCGDEIYDVLREECEQHYQNRPDYFTEMSKIVNRNSSNIWTLNSMEFPPAGPRSHVLYSGSVILKDCQLVLTLHPPKIGTSKRYYRIFPSERFLHIKIDMDMNNWDSKKKSNLKNLLLHPLPLAGRTYEFLYGKSDTLYYFATSGLGLPNSISIWEVINCNIPIENNKYQTTAKFYTRISLGFSNSTPTIVFKPNEIRIVKDVKINGNCFTDGCSAISLAAMKEVAEILGCEETPSAFQGRIGAAKGVWYVDPRIDISDDKWIELRESQVKYDVKRNPNDENDVIDVHLRTLEVLSVVVPPRAPGTLNSQFIPVLHNGGVPVDVFLEMIKNYIEKIKSEVVGCDDPHSLIDWVMNVANVMRKRLELLNHFENNNYSDNSNSENTSSMDAISGFPNSPSEQCIQMLQAGFTPSTCPFLAKKLKVILCSTLKSLFTKFHIDVPLSRVLLCIADPTGTLEPGEVFIQLDKRAGIDERTGFPFGIIEDDIIVARNPCGLPSDMVKVRAVKNTKLSIYYNIVIFPVKANEGDVSLAAYLSGGDYDGDKIFCCWDPRIVKHFKNSPLLPSGLEVKNAFVESKQTVEELMSSSTTSSEIEFKLQEVILDNYFKDLEPMLGIYDRWYKLQSSKFGISDKQSIYLAQMIATLVDSTKQGLTIKPSVKQRDNELFGKLPVPYWMNKCNNKSHPRTQSESGGDNFGVTDVMDWLYIKIEKEMKKVQSKEFSVVQIIQDPDPHISEFLRNEFIIAQQMEEEEGSAYKEDLNLICSHASEISQMYNKRYQDIFNRDQDRKGFEQLSSKSTSTNSSRLKDEFNGVNYEFMINFLNNPPVENYKSSIFKVLKDRSSNLENMDPLAMFELQVKAASLYLSSVEKKSDGQACWVIAFRILCNIKSQMIDNDIIGPRSIYDEIWQSLKIDKKWLKYKNEI